LPDTVPPQQECDVADIVGSGLIILFNGALAVADNLIGHLPLSVAVMAVCLAWLAACEIEELDRQGFRPTFDRGV
jgi:hypothetical protein